MTWISTALSSSSDAAFKRLKRFAGKPKIRPSTSSRKMVLPSVHARIAVASTGSPELGSNVSSANSSSVATCLSSFECRRLGPRYGTTLLVTVLMVFGN